MILLWIFLIILSLISVSLTVGLISVHTQLKTVMDDFYGPDAVFYGVDDEISSEQD